MLCKIIFEAKIKKAKVREAIRVPQNITQENLPLGFKFYNSVYKLIECHSDKTTHDF